MEKQQAKHIVSTYDADLENLKSMINEMGIMIEKQLFDSIKLLKQTNEEVIKRVIEDDQYVNNLEKKIRDFATKTLSKRQPLADDLRKILVALKLSSSMERIGDHASNIAYRVSLAKEAPVNYDTDSVFRLGESVLKNLSMALTSYDQDSKAIATTIPEEDKNIDLMYETCFREHITLMMENPTKFIAYGTQMLFIAKDLERIGDLSKNISKEVIYSLKGKL